MFSPDSRISVKPDARQITISITAPEGAVEHDLLTLDVGPEMTIADLKAAIQSDSRVPPQAQVLYHNGQELRDDSISLGQANIKQDDMLGLLVRNTRSQTPSNSNSTRRSLAPNAPNQAARGPGPIADAEMIRLQALGNPAVLNQVRAQSQDLANAVNDPSRWNQIFGQMQRQRDEAEAEKARELALLNADPFNVEAQAKIEEIIRQERVMENLQQAMDYHPEAFGRVHMLYIDVEVNGNKVKAFVDSGAQATIMSPSCAERCGITRLIDTRYGGQAVGVGTAKILGKVHSAQIKVGSLFLYCAFSVLEGKDVDLLFGLDMLKGHQACIDLKRGKLVIQDVEVPFLGEADIPKRDFAPAKEEMVRGPSGMSTSAITGATQPSSQVSENTASQQEKSSITSTKPEAERGQPTSASAESPFPAADIAKLMELYGVTREEAINTLEMAGGNIDIAAGLLYD
ncbi:MAG: hypothetical protein Q9181_003234 [Wetmoreana brouardii]